MAKKGLGKGLGALLNEEIIKDINDDSCKIIEIDINKIEPDKNQPRKNFDKNSLEELADSIKEVGVISPIIVKKSGEFYKIVSGERRWRASRVAGLTKIPVIVREYSDINNIQVSLIENLQREDLNIVEEALTYKKLCEKFNLSHEEVAKKVGKSRSVITNSLRVLKLDEEIQNLLVEQKISVGHAKAILGIYKKEVQKEVAKQIVENELNVRQTEKLVKNLNENENFLKKDELNNENEKGEKSKLEKQKSHIYEEIKRELNQILGTKVNIKVSKNKGKIEIEYYSENELERLIYLFKNLK